jgi:hypothetical protein
VARRGTGAMPSAQQRAQRCSLAKGHGTRPPPPCPPSDLLKAQSPPCSNATRGHIAERARTATCPLAGLLEWSCFFHSCVLALYSPSRAGRTRTVCVSLGSYATGAGFSLAPTLACTKRHRTHVHRIHTTLVRTLHVSYRYRVCMRYSSHRRGWVGFLLTSTPRG